VGCPVGVDFDVDAAEVPEWLLPDVPPQEQVRVESSSAAAVRAWLTGGYGGKLPMNLS
jgi:hypothetical protein